MRSIDFSVGYEPAGPVSRRRLVWFRATAFAQLPVFRTPRPGDERMLTDRAAIGPWFHRMFGEFDFVDEEP